MSRPVITPQDCFSYVLPEDRIAQRPAHPYDDAKMLVIECGAGSFSDKRFSNIAEIVEPGDLVVFNNSKVIPARLFGSVAGKGSTVELLLLREVGPDRWIAMGRPLKKLSSGIVVDVQGRLSITVNERRGAMEVEVSMSSLVPNVSARALLSELGSMPVPPYIRGGHGDAEDTIDYQSIFAKFDGSVAAPTASLHFTPAVVAGIAARGARVREVTLHVGAASFLPLWREGQTDCIMPPGVERCGMSNELVNEIRATKAAGKRVVAVGTTVVRALETIMRQPLQAEGSIANTDLFITPGFQWQAVDVLVTNFHQPHTTHLLLVEALMGRDLLSRAYRHALDNGYRFLSYGDGMVILP